MTDTTATQFTELTTQTTGPEAYIRINVTKTTKGYGHETTVSLRWENTVVNDEFLALRNGGVDGPEPAAVLLQQLLQLSDELAREEIARRQAEDEGQS